MAEIKPKAPKKIECKIKKRFKFKNSTPLRVREETVKLNPDEYEFALQNGCLY